MKACTGTGGEKITEGKPESESDDIKLNLKKARTR